MAHLMRFVGLAFAIAIIATIAIAVYFYAQGYRLDLKSQSIQTTSILIANSFPTDADIFLNGKRQGVTQKTMYLLPKDYKVIIQKEGYTQWEKTYPMTPEVVYRTDALMFTRNPSLSPLTNRGIIAPVVSPQGRFIVYIKKPDETTSVEIPGEEEKSGIFRAPLASSAFQLFQGTDLLLPYSSLPESTLEKTTYIFSPDEKQIMVFFYSAEDELVNVLLIPIGRPDSFLDITQSYETVLQRWEIEQKNATDALIDAQKKPIRDVLRTSAHIIAQSTQDERILYFATQSAQLPAVIRPPITGLSPVKEERTLTPSTYYVYDTKNDKNYHLDVFTPEEREETLESLKRLSAESTLSVEDWQEKYMLFKKIFWYGDSRHVVTILKDVINVVDYDGMNNVLVYSGPFDDTLYTTTSDGKIVIVTNLNPKRNDLPDLYAVSIK